jgi:lipopolysaccharide biosynthesis regulator YciM
MKRRDEDDSHDLRNIELIKSNYEDKINETRAAMEKRIIDSYSDGYADAIEAVAKVKGLDTKILTEEVIENL